ncbi:hypothetical protein CS022_02230 [Veronia nyctiphanis]|uniref:Uncharacterized protein n=1 Tax=Veronia nyctiphanis TaxID=1278244 RepID=A0A4Q0YUI1_9GAMM|nr:hypothetical protein [Veronia nyctiphanis]RXJ74443.1 hypothetical protein CS022_02230 [Veronia nyctiphanis]
MALTLDYLCYEMQADIDMLKQALKKLDREKDLLGENSREAMELIASRIDKLEVRERMLKN